MNDNPTSSDTIIVPGENLVEKLKWLNSNAQSNGNYIIEINIDENIDSQHSILSYSDKSNITITIKGINCEQIISLSSKGHLFKVDSNVTLILDKNITLRGISDNDKSLVDVSGTLVMNEGSAITDNTTELNGMLRLFATTGGVHVCPAGTFIMNGGIISGNKTSGGAAGGGVTVGGTFIMKGGTISGNSSMNGGGVNVILGSFIMEGGIISGNRAEGGGGVHIADNAKSFVKTGGTITGYASDTVNGNVVIINGKIADYSWAYKFGHAIIYFGKMDDNGSYIDETAKCKDTTSGPDDNMSYIDGNFTGVWDGKITPPSTNVDSDSASNGCGCYIVLIIVIIIIIAIIAK